MNKKEEAKLTHQLACVTYLTRDILEDIKKHNSKFVISCVYY